METNNISKDGKLAAIIAHLTFLGPIIAWFINQEEKDKFGTFYIKQSVGIFVLFLLISAILPIVPDFLFMPTLVGFYIFICILFITSNFFIGKSFQAFIFQFDMEKTLCID